MTVLRAGMYKAHMIYILQIKETYFEYLVEFNGEIYSSYIIIKPTKGKRKLTAAQVQECAALIYNGAVATVDALLGDQELSEKEKEIVETFEKYEKEMEKQNGSRRVGSRSPVAQLCRAQ